MTLLQRTERSKQQHFAGALLYQIKEEFSELNSQVEENDYLFYTCSPKYLDTPLNFAIDL